jgi:hypothetical protein
MINILLCDDEGNKTVYECDNLDEFQKRMSHIIAASSRITVLQTATLIVHQVVNMQELRNIIEDRDRYDS